jgi:hypothetical protein
MTCCYDKSGIRFLYPANWQISDEEVDGNGLSVSVQSPDSAFWSLTVYDPGTEPRTLVEAVLTSMRGEYEEVEASVIHERFADSEWLGYEMCFYCLDFLVNSKVMATRAIGKTLLIIWQAEDREFDQLEPVFRAITLSLLKPQTIDAARERDS